MTWVETVPRGVSAAASPGVNGAVWIFRTLWEAGGKAHSVIRLTWRPRVDDARETMALVVLRREDDAVDLGSIL